MRIGPLILITFCVLLPAGCERPNAVDLHDAKFRVDQLHAGMQRKKIEEILQPLKSHLLDSSVSGNTVIQYRLKPNLWVQISYDGSNNLIRVPSEFLISDGDDSSEYQHFKLIIIK
jgi:hypothetical protein